MKLTLTILSSLLLAVGSTNALSNAYPLKTCLVSGNDLGSMGAPISKAYNGQTIIFCCKPCVKKFDANPAKYLAKLPKS